jgi:nitrogen fixation/metabolism regulation signal transduction histidine kinase
MLEQLVVSAVNLIFVLVLMYVVVKLYYETKRLQKDTEKLHEKIDLLEKIEKLVSNIQVKKEEDKDKIKQFFIKRFGSNEGGG